MERGGASQLSSGLLTVTSDARGTTESPTAWEMLTVMGLDGKRQDGGRQKVELCVLLQPRRAMESAFQLAPERTGGRPPPTSYSGGKLQPVCSG